MPSRMPLNDKMFMILTDLASVAGPGNRTILLTALGIIIGDQQKPDDLTINHLVAVQKNVLEACWKAAHEALPETAAPADVRSSILIPLFNVEIRSPGSVKATRMPVLWVDPDLIIGISFGSMDATENT